jgi:hypothetical protein
MNFKQHLPSVLINLIPLLGVILGYFNIYQIIIIYLIELLILSIYPFITFIFNLKREGMKIRYFIPVMILIIFASISFIGLAFAFVGTLLIQWFPKDFFENLNYNFLIIPLAVMFLINLFVFIKDNKEIRLRLSASRFFIRLVTLFSIALILGIFEKSESIYLLVAFIITKIFIEDYFLTSIEKNKKIMIKNIKNKEEWIIKNKHRILRFQKKKT